MIVGVASIEAADTSAGANRVACGYRSAMSRLRRFTSAPSVTSDARAAIDRLRM